MDDALAEVTVFRDPVPADVPFILDSWIRSFRESPWAGCVPNNQFYDVTRSAIEGLLERGAKLVVACSRVDSDQILGWACTEKVRGGDAAHFVYVKDPYRRRGLATELLNHGTANPQAQDRKFYTFRTRCASYFSRHGWVHEPAIARRK